MERVLALVLACFSTASALPTGHAPEVVAGVRALSIKEGRAPASLSGSISNLVAKDVQLAGTPPQMKARFRNLQAGSGDPGSGSGDQGSGSGSGEMSSGSGEMGSGSGFVEMSSGSGEMGSGYGSGYGSGSGWMEPVIEEDDASPPPPTASSPPPAGKGGGGGKGEGKGGGDSSPPPVDSSPPPPAKQQGGGGDDGDDEEEDPAVAGDGEMYATEIKFVISGSVDDVTDADKLGYATFFAEFADVALDKVYVDAVAASVEIIITIYSDSASAAALLKTAVENDLSDPTTLQSLLAAAGITVTVEQGATAEVTVAVLPAGGPQFSTSSGSDAPVGAIVGGVVGGVVVIALVVGVIVMKGKGGKGGTQQV
jgi:hypothetical protein